MMKREENHSSIISFHPHLINMPETDLVTTGLWVICLLKNLLHASFMTDVPFFVLLLQGIFTKFDHFQIRYSIQEMPFSATAVICLVLLEHSPSNVAYLVTNSSE
jgi:hypothetical protein